VAQAVAGEIQVKLTPQEQARLAPRRAVNPEAQEAYLKGIYWSDKFEWAKAMDYFLEATRKDPDYAAAYAALSAVYGNMINAGLLSDKEGYPKWRAVVTRAMELDDSLAEAHVSLGVLLQYHDWNWTEGDRELRRAIQLNPNLALAHLWHGDGLCMTGRPDQAIPETKRALQLDPYSVVANGQLGYELVFARRNDEAIEQGRKIDSSLPGLGHWIIGVAYEQKGDSQRAIPELQQMLKLGKDQPALPEGLADLAHAYAVSGRKQDALTLLAELTEMAKKRFVPSWGFAMVYVGLGDKDHAFEWLDKAYDERPGDIMNIKVDPRMNPIRSDARYQELLLRMGLPK
jgi:tetratricopeptide (TPR) repeat protein